jgi:ribulose-phosphate 3-epimerase
MTVSDLLGRLLLAPSIASADHSNLREVVELAQKGGADLLHFDLEDGVFLPNITFGPKTVRSLRPRSDLPFDVHVELADPEAFLPEIVEAGADVITVHSEACPYPHRTLKLIRSYGVKAGIAYNAGTSIDSLPYILDQVDIVHLMTSDPDVDKSTLIPSTIDKVQKTSDLIGSREIQIEVDGGINIENCHLLIAAGANIYVIGRAIWQADDPVQQMHTFRSLFDKGAKG